MLVIQLVLIVCSVASATQALFIDFHERNNRKANFSRFLHDILAERGEHLAEVSIQLDSTPSPRAELNASQELQSCLSALEVQSLRFIYINTHGISDSRQAHLSGIGSIYEDGWGTMFERTLGHLRQRLAPDAVVIISSCWHFHGEGAERRARSLGRFLGMRNGILMGVRNRGTTPTLVEPQSPYFDPSVGLYTLYELVRSGHVNSAKIFRFQNGEIVTREDTQFDLSTIRRCTMELRAG